MRIDPLWAVELGPVKVNAVNVIEAFILGAVLLWGQSVVRRRIAAWRAARQDRRHADHTTIATGWYSDDLKGASTEYLACLRVAPSKRLPVPVRLDVARIAPLVHNAFGDLYPPEPEVSLPNEVVRYRREDTGQPGLDQFVVVWPSGLIEALVPMTYLSDANGEPVISLLEIARVLLPAVRAIQQGGYEQMLGPDAVIPLGLDWEFKVSRELVGSSPKPWSALVFPGRVPDGRATNGRPPWPRPGFGRDQVQCVGTTKPAEEILLPALADLVERSGYYGTEEAMSGLHVAISRLDVETTSPESAASTDS